jgi:acyl-CoA thioester hydrolase
MEGYPLTIRFPMHWGEMDALGHANNARYFTWFESARIALFERLALTARPGSSVGPVLASVQCDYRRPVVYPADLVVGVRVSKVGRSSIVTEYAVARAEAEDEALAVGEGTVVLVDYGTMKAVPIPDEVRAALADLLRPGRA